MTEGPPGAPTAGRTAPLLLPLWTLSLDWELRRGRQVILHGEVQDRFWLRGQPVGFRELMTSYLLSTGAEIVGWWDPVDGLAFPVAGHQERFYQVAGGNLASAGSGAQGGDASQENAADGGGADGGGTDGGAPGSLSSRRTAMQARSRRITAPRGPARVAGLHDVLAEVRRLTATPEIASAFVFADVDAVLTPGNEDAATDYLWLRAAMREAVVPVKRAGPPPHARNAVIAVTGDVSRLPAWLYQEDPRVQALRITRPDAAERRLWLSMLRDDFNGVRDEADLEPLVGATDGLAGWHLDALARTSVIRNVPVHKITRLLDAYHFNVRSNPWAQLDARMVRDSGSVLAQRVIGQDAAVTAVAEVLQTAFVGVDFGSSAAARPRGVFFFVGPTGVGKTELAKAVATLIFGDESALARFDMSEYSQEHAAERLAGAPPGYVGYEQGGELTRRMQEHPFSVLLFDEIEKAHPAVLDKFLQILEDGRLTDGRGETAYFSQSLIIFTSNTGADTLRTLMAESGPGTPVAYEDLKKHFEDAVRATFDDIHRPEIFGRLEPGIVVFDMLRPQHIAGITNRLIDLLVESVRERHGIDLVVDREAILARMNEAMREPKKLRYGGRQIRNEMEEVRAAFVRHFVTAQPAAGTQIHLGVGPDGKFTARPGPQAGPAGTSGP